MHLIKLNLIIYHSIALLILYRKSFGSNGIWPNVCPQIRPEQQRQWKERTPDARFREFAAERFDGSNRVQRNVDRAFHEL